MKVLFLTHKLETPSVKWRVRQFLPVLETLGMQPVICPLPKGYTDLWRVCGEAAQYDAVVLQKRLLPSLFMKRLRDKARRLIYEFDDAVTLKRSTSGVVRPSVRRRRRFQYIVSAADAVVTTNAYLAGLCREFRPGEGIHILPNAIDPRRWRPKSDYKTGPTLTLGWQGTASNLTYLKALEEPLHRVRQSGLDVTLKVVADQPLELPGIPVVFQAYSAERENEDILSFDVGVSTLPDDDWTRGKQPVKILCYFAAGLPVIASGVRAHAGLIDDGVNGLLAGSPDEWITQIKRLAASETSRRSLGTRARRDAETTYSVENAGAAYAEIIRSP